MVTVKCPYCGEENTAPGEIDFYRWEGNAGYEEIACPECHCIIGLEVTAHINEVETVRCGVSSKFLDELYLEHCESLVDWKREEG